MRACYTANMRFYFDSSVEVPVVWYPCAKDAPPMPWASSFCSRQWEDKDSEQPPIGERYVPKIWRSGISPGDVGSGGLCGTEDQWVRGSSAMDPLPSRYPRSNVPRCCSPPEPRLIGAIGYGALGEESTIPCLQAVFGASLPLSLHVQITPANGIWPLTLDVPYHVVGEYWGKYIYDAPSATLFSYDFACYGGQIYGLVIAQAPLEDQTPVDYAYRDFFDPVAKIMKWNFNVPASAGFAAWIGTVTVTWA